METVKTVIGPDFAPCVMACKCCTGTFIAHADTAVTLDPRSLAEPRPNYFVYCDSCADALIEHEAEKKANKLDNAALIYLIQSALDTAETGLALVEVARNAHRAEMELANVTAVLESQYPDSALSMFHKRQGD